MGVMKNILVTASGGKADNLVFATAHAIARPLAAHLAFYHVHAKLADGVANTRGADFARGVALSHALHSLAAESEYRLKTSRRHFQEFCARSRIKISKTPGPRRSMTASWRDEEGHNLSELLLRARHHDLVVLSRHVHADGLAPEFVDQILMSCGRPIVIAGNTAPKNVTGTIVVFWKETPEAARAVTAAMALLAKAKRVIIATAEEGSDASAEGAVELARELKWNGINAEPRCIASDGRSAAARLAKVARDCKADLLVMGAYSRSWMRRVLFGGCTQSFLDGADRPILLVH
jgi:nucleotide-binding universal stress UspA family protein